MDGYVCTYLWMRFGYDFGLIGFEASLRAPKTVAL